MKVTEEAFHNRIKALGHLRGKFKAVTGPGRSGAIAAVYASYFLNVPFIPFGHIATAVRPILIIDTTSHTGKTMKKAVKKYGWANVTTAVLFDSPPILTFWYED